MTYNYMPQGSIFEDIDGQLYCEVDLLKGIKRPLNRAEIISNYQPKSCLIENKDGEIFNLIDLLLSVGQSSGSGSTTQPTVDLQEVIDARTNLWGEEFETLKERLDADYKELARDLEISRYYPYSGTGELSEIKHTSDGIMKGLYIEGNTVNVNGTRKSVGEESNKITILSSNCKPNLVKNSGFLDGYNNYTTYRSVPVVIVDDDSACSKKALKFTSADSDRSGIYQRSVVSVIENTKYTLSGWCKGEVGTTLNINIEGHKGISVNFTNEEWVRFEITSETNPVNWNGTITFYGANSVKTYFLKDIKVEKSDFATPYIPHTTESHYSSFMNKSNLLSGSKTSTKEILLPFNGGLKSLNGVCDVVEDREDGIYAIQRISEDYQLLTTPVEYKIEECDLNINTYQDVTYLSFENDIKPEYIECEIPYNVDALVNGLLQENRSLQNANLLMANELEEAKGQLEENNNDQIATQLDLDMRLMMLEMGD